MSNIPKSFSCTVLALKLFIYLIGVFMKLTALSALAILSIMSSSAFATHAYRSESCKSATHELFYKGNYAIGGDYGIKTIDQTEDIKALPLNDSETTNTLDDAEVIFNEGDSKITKEIETTSDCGFEHQEWRSEKEITINLISTEASKILGLKSGDKMTFTCEESFDMPDGSDCK
jgi:hypothetical protein